MENEHDHDSPGQELSADDILFELAELGSVETLLAQHDGLQPEQVAAALRSGGHAVTRLEETRPPASPLYRAHNGFMLGLFVSSAHFFHKRGEKEAHRQTIGRIAEFMLEVCHQFGEEFLPDEESPDDFETVLENRLRSLDEEMAEFFLLGTATVECVVLAATSSVSEEDRQEVYRRMSDLGHPPVILDRTLERVAELEADKPSWQQLMSECIWFLREVVAGLRPEKDTCFVAMPFRQPYEERYLNFYRAVAARLGCRAIRAWGGFGNEDYQELLLALIAKSSALIADVTEVNVNVALEIGVALGDDKDVYLLAEGEQWRNAANVQLDWVYPYEVPPGDELAWIEPAVERAGAYMTALKSLRRPGKIPSWSAKPSKLLKAFGEILNTVQEDRDSTDH